MTSPLQTHPRSRTLSWGTQPWIAFIVQLVLGTATIMAFMAVITNEWIVVNENSTQSPTQLIGLTLQCSRSRCSEKDYGAISSCGVSAADLRDRYRSILAFLCMALILGFVATVLVSLAFYTYQKARDGWDLIMRDDEYLTSMRCSDCIERLKLSQMRIQGMLVCVTSCTLANIIGFALYEGTTNSYVHCGKSICQYLKSAEGGAAESCESGVTYRFGIAALVLNCIAVVVALIWFMMNRAQGPEQVKELKKLRKYARSLSATPHVSGSPLTKESLETFDDYNPRERPVSMYSHPGYDENEPIPEKEEKKETSPSPSQKQHHPAPKSPQVNEDQIPEGDWVLDEGGLYWSETEKLFYDPRSGHFYDPETGDWYNPVTDEWYSL